MNPEQGGPAEAFFFDDGAPVAAGLHHGDILGGLADAGELLWHFSGCAEVAGAEGSSMHPADATLVADLTYLHVCSRRRCAGKQTALQGPHSRVLEELL